MKNEIYPLSQDGTVTLTTYVMERSTVKWNNRDPWEPEGRPAVIVCPGGGYWFLSQREGEPVALSFLQQGYQAFVLHYSLQERSAFPNPLEDISKAVWFVRSHAGEFNIDPEKIAVCGFSAGGHVCAMLGTQWNTPGLCQRLGIPEGGNKPNAMVLCYAALDFNAISRRMKGASKLDGVAAISRQLPPEADTSNYISGETVPAFLWITREDMLDCTDYLRFSEKLYAAGVPFELHLFGEGPHGMSLSSPLVAYGYELPVNVGQWFPLCVNWLNKRNDFGKPEPGKVCKY